MTWRTRLELAAAALLLAALALTSWRLDRTRDDLVSARHARDSIAIEIVADSAARAGWTVAWADTLDATRDSLRAVRAHVDTLAGQVERAHGRLAGYVSLVAVLEDSVRSVATSQDTTEAVPLWWAGEIDDGLLRSSWMFAREDAALTLPDYSVRIPGELITAEGGDGRRLVTARATDPRARLELGSVWIEPPPRVVVRVCDARTRIRWGLGGVLVGAVGWELAR